ncbi:MAG: hypothetical protein K8U03_17600 [Planctomycetia bacterium]|nr:hypothetical protein [Planctomycetia bacterium]
MLDRSRWSGLVACMAAIVSMSPIAAAQVALAQQRIALRIDWPEHAPAAVSFPVYCGLSMPKGAISDAKQVHIVDGAGKTVTADLEPLAKWTADASLKWLGVRFLAQRGTEYFAVASPADRRPGLRVADDADAIRIETGAATFELPKKGPLLGKISVGEAIASPGGSACLVVKDHVGRVGDELQSAPPTIEYQGTDYAVVRREGMLQTATGETLGKYVVRLEFFAGSATLKAQHSFIVTEDTNKTQFADLAFQVATNKADRRPVWFDADSASDDAPLTGTLAAGETAHILQSEYPHHGQKVSRREIRLPRAEVALPEIGTPEQPAAIGDWAAVQAGTGGVLVAMPNAAQLFPKEFEIAEGTIAAHLWSSRGGRLLDYRISSLVDYWGLAWVDKKFPGGSAAMRKRTANAQGSARTHDLWLHFFSAEQAAAVPAVGMLCSRAPLVVQDPHWMRKTEALGFIHPYDPQRFPKLEKFLHDTVRDYPVAETKRWGDYGFLDFGCGQHSYDNYFALPGSEMPRLDYRYADQMYHAQTAFWQAYARSGDRMYHDYTHALHRHLADFKFAHVAGNTRSLGSRVGNGGSEDNPYYWSGIEDRYGGGTLNGHQGFDPEGFLLQHYLTGDRWSEEIIVRSGEVFLKRFQFDALPQIGASSDGAQPFQLVAPLYSHTGDDRYREALDKIRSRMIDLDTMTGWADPDYYGAWEKYPIKISGALADWRASQSPTTLKMLVEKAFPIWLWDVPVTNFGYQEQSGYFANFAYRLTGNIRYAELMEERFNRVLFEFYDAQGKRRDVSGVRGGPHAGGTHAFNFLETAYYGMDLLVETEGKRGPYVALDTGAKCHPVEIHFAKDRHQPLKFELRFNPGYDLRVTHAETGYGRPSRDYDVGPVHWNSYPNYFTKEALGLGGGFAKLEMGAETVEGEYRFTNIPFIFKHTAKKLVVVARDGIVLRATHDTPPVWHFQVPAQKTGAIYANKPITLDDGGKRIDVAAGQWYAPPVGASDRMISIHCSGLVFVAFRGGIPPILAQHDPKLYFVPRVVQEQMPAREAEASSSEVTSDAPFVAGLTHKPDDEAFVLKEKRSLRVPRGAKIGEGQYERIDYRNGTLEFWFQPRQSTGMSAVNFDKYAISGALWPVSLRRYGGDDEDPRGGNQFSFQAPCSAKPPVGSKQAPYPYPGQDLRNPTTVVGGRWHHFALSWATDPKRGWLSEMYLDGKPSLGWARADTGHGRFCETENPTKYFPPMPWPIDEPKGDAILFVGDVLDAAIDELRISKVGRYPQAFEAPSKRRFEKDDDTLLLMRFDGNEEPAP